MLPGNDRNLRLFNGINHLRNVRFISCLVIFLLFSLTDSSKLNSVQEIRNTRFTKYYTRVAQRFALILENR